MGGTGNNKADRWHTAVLVAAQLFHQAPHRTIADILHAADDSFEPVVSWSDDELHAVLRTPRRVIHSRQRWDAALRTLGAVWRFSPTRTLRVILEHTEICQGTRPVNTEYDGSVRAPARFPSDLNGRRPSPS